MEIENFDNLYRVLEDTKAKKWIPLLKSDINAFFRENLHGDYNRWHDNFKELPDLKVSEICLNQDTVSIGNAADCSPDSHKKLYDCLKKFHPWRKGPYNLFGIHIDTEWHSDWKWRRLFPHISNLKNRLVLDIGCGNGYHCWRILANQAKLVIGVDPNQLFLFQFLTLKKYCPEKNIFLLPFGIEQLPKDLASFDTVFSMGVLYHRRSPIDHLIELKNLLRKDGELILETLIIEDDQCNVLVPEGRYGKMRNVWFIPSVGMMKLWLEKVGFSNVKCVDVTATSIQEQRSTDWMRFESLSAFLDPADYSKTIEGHPGPVRAIFVANNPTSFKE